MKSNFTFILMWLLCVFSLNTRAQTQFWSDTFESTPSSGTRTPEVSGGTTTSYFRLTDGSTISQVVSFSGKEGSNYWAGEDHNGLGTGFPSEGSIPPSNPLNELQIDWTNINITGKLGLSFKGLLAAASTNEPWDNQNSCISGVGTTNTDYIIVEYSIDGGSYINLLRFYNKGSASGTGDKYLFEDTDNNGCGDGTQLTNVFGEFSKNIVGTGTTMNLRIRVFSEGNNEEWGIDNFRLYETPACSIVLTPASQTNVSCFGGSNGAASVNTPTGGTGGYTYNWTPGNPTGDGTNSISGLTAGIWTCTVTDANLCQATQSFTITQPTAISTASGSQTNVSCNGGTNGTASVSPSGGTPGYTYSWSPSGGTAATA
ncbi:SprB repeat-containing protein, partial [Flavobacterium sp.]|uniref:SprB repeat-containing protein n=1 Tax=Flavobacterium sp. TaxID=239 RepID=UPI0025BEFCEE